jgi:SAM-dependent methyltransferase
LPNVSFFSGDIAEIALDRAFDAVVGRCVLFFLPDPASALRQLVLLLRPGGIVAFQEPGNAVHRPYALPPSPLLDRMWDWILELYRRAGMDVHSGLRVFHHFRAAGLPAPTMYLDAAVGGGPDWAGYDYMAGLVRTLLPLFVHHGIATEEDVDIETFAERLRQEVSGQQGVATTWSFITAWARKP